jgi:cellobiose-specific phosphotransferase system component IIC
MLGGWTFSTFRRTRYQYIAVVTLMTLFLGLNATASEHTPVRATAFVAVASGMIGATNCMSILISQLGARDEDIGIVTGLGNSFRSAGGAIGVAIYSSLLTNRISITLPSEVSEAVIEAGLPVSSVPGFLGTY